MNEVVMSIAGTVVVATLGWVWSVEQRFAALMAMKETVDKVDARVEKLYDHLLGEKSESNDKDGR